MILGFRFAEGCWPNGGRIYGPSDVWGYQPSRPNDVGLLVLCNWQFSTPWKNWGKPKIILAQDLQRMMTTWWLMIGKRGLMLIVSSRWKCFFWSGIVIFKGDIIKIWKTDCEKWVISSNTWHVPGVRSIETDRTLIGHAMPILGSLPSLTLRRCRWMARGVEGTHQDGYLLLRTQEIPPNGCK